MAPRINKMTAPKLVVDDRPKAKVFREKVGAKEFELAEARLDVFEDVTLWDKNPRLQPFIPGTGVESEEELEQHLTRTRGYAGLATSIKELGQMEPVYVWRRDETGKYLIIEGATRITVLRDLARRNTGKPEFDRWRFVTAKVLPADFSFEDRAILLATIHVRGTGVRQWERYTQAKFVYDTVTDRTGQRALMSLSRLAEHMGKSVSWASRLRDAYEFARKYVEYVDSDEAEREAVARFSILEEISKTSGFGPKVKDYQSDEGEKLRADVFDMVQNEVFKEYRDARHMQKFFEDKEKWALLKTHERHVANRLAIDINAGSTSVKGKIEHLQGQIERTLDKNSDALTEEDLDHLQAATAFLEGRLHGGSPFRFRLRRLSQALANASLNDVRSVTDEELNQIDVGLADARGRLQKFGRGS